MTQIKTLNDFTSSVKTSLATIFPDCKIDTTSVVKNNGIHLSGLIIRPENTQNTTLVPTIYLDPYFAKLKSGKPFNDILDEITDSYKAALKEAENTNINIKDISNFAIAKDKICYRLVNKELNKELLETIPHRDFFDLAIIYYIELPSIDGVMKSVKVTNELATIWNIDEEQLYKIACENISRINRGCVVPLTDITKEAAGMYIPNGMEHITDDKFDITFEKKSKLPLYIVTNERKMYGAGVILYYGLPEILAEKLNNFFILPSSVHECIIVPGKLEEAKTMVTMVRSANISEVSQDEILSENCFYYDATSHKLQIAV